MGAKRRKNAYKAPTLANRIKKRSKANRKLNLMANPVSEIWDKGKTLRKNYQEINIALDLNQQPKVLEKIQNEEMDLPELTDMNYFKKKSQKLKENNLNELQNNLLKRSQMEANRKSKRKAKINREEGLTVKALLEKFGEDYAQWEKNIKINIFQWNENQCKNKHRAYCERFGTEGNIDWTK